MAGSPIRPQDFQLLVENGMEFLEQAFKQLVDGELKHSVISFYTAVELFLKAPLVRDHWALVIADRLPNRMKYESGDFVSVAFDETCKRLDETLGKPLRDGAKEAFDRVRKHRNRTVHFYHANAERDKDAIMLEQAQAWFELDHFVSVQWKTEFEPVLQRFRWMERRLVARNHYAKAKFNNLKTAIAAASTGGTVFRKCDQCGMKASEITKPYSVVPELIHQRYWVCFHRNSKLQLACPSCHATKQVLEASEAFKCKKCSHVVEGESSIYQMLDESNTNYDNYMDALTPANCDDCQSHESVCEYKDGYLCVNCLGYFDRLYRCECCSASCTDAHEDSYYIGCEFCDGCAGGSGCDD